MITITRLYDDYAIAARAYNELKRAGISTDDISIVASNGDGWFEKGATEPGKIDRDGDGSDDRNEGAAKGGAIGGAVGGVAGLLAGLGILAIPGLGPVVAAGWLASTAALAFTGGAAGGLIGSLSQHGVKEDDANAYAEGVRRGGTLVTAKVDEKDAPQVESILATSAVDLTVRRAMWEQGGWNRFDPAAPSYTADEIRRERELYRTRV
ncbi:MAG TPA: hypothetical protein VHY35_05335 [Stellaceae bacterium]|jgi:hypothetical protein|nr:hypothetical protein [Stellaceae bacterium]